MPCSDRAQRCLTPWHGRLDRALILTRRQQGGSARRSDRPHVARRLYLTNRSQRAIDQDLARAVDGRRSECRTCLHDCQKCADNITLDIMSPDQFNLSSSSERFPARFTTHRGCPFNLRPSWATRPLSSWYCKAKFAGLEKPTTSKSARVASTSFLHGGLPASVEASPPEYEPDEAESDDVLRDLLTWALANGEIVVLRHEVLQECFQVRI